MGPKVRCLSTGPGLNHKLRMPTARIATLAETANDLEDLSIDVPPEERLPDFSTPWPWDFDTMAVALSLVQAAREEAKKVLEEFLAGWLSEDPENWPVLRLTLIDPWQERPGIWSEHTPEWIRTLATCATAALEKFGPVQRRPTD
jgi:hypothetical protein